MSSISRQNNTITAPTLFLSSEAHNWEGLTLRTYLEPMEIEGWIDPIAPDIVLVQLTRGAMHMEQRQKNGFATSLHIRQGNLFLKPAGNRSPELYWKSLTLEPLQTVHLHLSTDLFSRTAAEIIGSDPSHLVLQGRSGFTDPLLQQLGLALQQELAHPALASKLYAQTAAQMLAVHLLRHYTSVRKAVREPLPHTLSRQQMARLLDFVHVHLSENISLEALAQQVGYSPYYFARLFRHTTGESPHQFVLRQRIERAQALLKAKQIPLAHVAVESGFANQSHLTQAFKRYLGLTPRAYRQNSSTRADF